MRQIVVNQYLHSPPDLCVEILSSGPANQHRDRNTKRDLYSQYGVQEYWIVDPESRSVEIMRAGEHGLQPVALLSEGEILTTPLLPGFSLPVAEVFADVEDEE